MKDPIHLCDVVLYDGKAKKEYKISNQVLAGNNKNLIWQSEGHRDRLIKNVFKTKSRIAKQTNNLSLHIKSIDYKIYLGDSFHDWGTSK